MDPNNQNPPTQQDVPLEPAQQPVNDLTPTAFPKKKILSLAIGIIVVLIIIFVGFMFVIAPGNKDKNVTLEYWGLWEDPVVYEQVIKDYEQKHPNVKIHYEKQNPKVLLDSTGGYLLFLQSRIRKGTGPDIYRFHSSWVSQLANTYLMPLPSSVVSSTGLKDQFYGTVGKDLTYKKAYYGIPLGIDTLALFVNDELFQAAGYEVPKDWDTFLDVSRKLTLIDQNTDEIKISGVALGTYSNIAHAPDIISMLLAQSGVYVNTLFSDDKESETAARSTAASVLEYYTSFARDDDQFEAIWSESMEKSTAAFAHGKVAMFFGYTWDIFEIKQGYKSNIRFSIHPVPALGPKNNQTSASYWADGVSSNSPHQKEAYEFLAYMGSKEVLQKLYAAQTKQREFGELYPRKDLGATLSGNPLLASFLSQGDSAVTSPFSADTYDGTFNTRLNKYLADAVNGMVKQHSSADSVMTTLLKGIQDTYTTSNANPTGTK